MPYRNADETKISLITSAEALVALHGLQGVSAREIARRSGMKNNVVVQYHFNSIDQLYDEVVKFRMLQLEAVRAELVRGRDIDQDDIAELMSLVCLPHLQIQDENGSYPYATFLCHYLPERRPQGFAWVMAPGETFAPLMQTIIRLIHAKLPGLPAELFNRRMTNATLLFLNILRGFPQLAQGQENLLRHPLIVDGVRQSIAVLSTSWLGAPADRP